MTCICCALILKLRLTRSRPSCILNWRAYFTEGVKSRLQVRVVRNCFTITVKKPKPLKILTLGLIFFFFFFFWGGGGEGGLAMVEQWTTTLTCNLQFTPSHYYLIQTIISFSTTTYCTLPDPSWFNLSKASCWMRQKKGGLSCLAAFNAAILDNRSFMSNTLFADAWIYDKKKKWLQTK